MFGSFENRGGHMHGGSFKMYRDGEFCPVCADGKLQEMLGALIDKVDGLERLIKEMGDKNGS